MDSGRFQIQLMVRPRVLERLEHTSKARGLTLEEEVSRLVNDQLSALQWCALEIIARSSKEGRALRVSEIMARLSVFDTRPTLRSLRHALTLMRRAGLIVADGRRWLLASPQDRAE